MFSGRAAYIHVGAMFGTIMTLNVWERILPAQRKMIAASAAGTTFDASLGAQAKLRSKHNTFMAVPVVFLMLSNHYPVATYGNTIVGRFWLRPRARRVGGGEGHSPGLMLFFSKHRTQCGQRMRLQIVRKKSSPGARSWRASAKTPVARGGRFFLRPCAIAIGKSPGGWSRSGPK